MFGYKKLKKRIESLEDDIGVVWDGAWKVHFKRAYGRLMRFDEIIEEREKEKKAKNKG